jgi:hypothetical protein
MIRFKLILFWCGLIFSSTFFLVLFLQNREHQIIHFEQSNDQFCCGSNYKILNYSTTDLFVFCQNPMMIQFHSEKMFSQDLVRVQKRELIQHNVLYYIFPHFCFLNDRFEHEFVERFFYFLSKQIVEIPTILHYHIKPKKYFSIDFGTSCSKVKQYHFFGISKSLIQHFEENYLGESIFQLFEYPSHKILSYLTILNLISSLPFYVALYKFFK